MLNMQRCIENITASFNEVEKLALLKAMQEVYNADEKYDTMESIGFESIRDVLMLETSEDAFQNAVTKSEPLIVFAGKEKKQLLVLESMFDAAIVDNVADAREADCLINYIREWDIPLETIKNIMQNDLYYYLDLGLSEVHAAFIDLLDSRYPLNR